MPATVIMPALELAQELTPGVLLQYNSATLSKPIVVLEHADRMNDSTYVLRELIRRGAKKAAVPFLWDPESAKAACEAGAAVQPLDRRLVVGVDGPAAQAVCRRNRTSKREDNASVRRKTVRVRLTTQWSLPKSPR